MDLHVLIATSGQRPGLLERTLASIEAAHHVPTLRTIWLIENGPAGGTQAVAQAFADRLPVRFVHEPQFGKCRALNRALREIGTGLAIFLDDDVRIAAGFFEIYAAAAETEPAGAYFGGPISADYEREPHPDLRRWLPLSARGWEAPVGADVTRDLLFLGFNWAAPIEVILQLGGFCEDLGPGTPARVGDENDMQLRLQRAGMRSRYLREARVWHYVPRSRCAPDWIVERGFYSGRSKAFEMPSPGLSIRGRPLWVLRRCATTAIRAVGARVVGSESMRLRCLYGQSVNLGLLAGFRERWRKNTTASGLAGASRTP